MSQPSCAHTEGASAPITSMQQRLDILHGDIAAGGCCEDPFGIGGLGPGSLPPIGADIAGGPFPDPTYGPFTAHGPQLDVLFVNTAPVPIIPVIQLNRAAGFGFLEPGAHIYTRDALAVWPINTAPGVIVPGVGSLGAMWIEDRAGDGPGPVQSIHSNSPVVPGVASVFVPPGFTGPLAPGDFVWVSTLALVQAVGFTGPSAIFFGFGGSGATILVEGVKL